MLTTDGKTHVKRYLAGSVPTIGRSIAFGLGNSIEQTTDVKLNFEAGRSDVALVSFDFVANKLVFKGNVDDSFGGKIYEVALYSAPSNDAAGQYNSKMITTFSADLENWADATTAAASSYTFANSRIGNDSLSQTPSASGTKTDTLTQLFLDLSGYSSADKFVFAFNVNNAFTSSIRFRFMTDSANYYEIALGAQTTGYKIVEATKGSAVATGTPDWGDITEVRVSSSSTAGGSSSIDFDGIRIDDADSYNQDYLMVAREVLATPFTKVAGSSQEVEISFDVGIS